MLTNSTYEVTLEEEARGSGYCDLLMRPKSSSGGGEVPHLLELKYLPKSAGSEANVQRAAEESVRQLQRYGQVHPAASLEHLRRTAAVFVGCELRLVLEA